MVNYCVCAGCKNSTQTGHSVHGFPMKDKATVRQWVQFVCVRRANFSMTSVTTNSKICSAHFREEDYDQGDIRMVSLGLKRLTQEQLIPTAVPSVHTHLSACPAPKPRSTNIGATRRKRELATMLTAGSTQETADSLGTTDEPLPTSSTCATGTQCNLKPSGMLMKLKHSLLQNIAS
nr:THAP domain-containing protein 10-like [Misgurnus anguillicaudatus]